MIIFNCKNLSCSFGDKTVLENVTLTVYEKDRIGVIGANGCGKTTLIKILTGLAEFSFTGEVTRAAGVPIGYIEQNAGASASEATVKEEFLTVFRSLAELELQIAATEEELRRAGLSQEETVTLSARLSRLYEEYVEGGGNTYRSRVESTLRGLKLGGETQDLPVKALSGGQKTRLALGKALLLRPPVLILDEPTNHLDLESVQWLEETLKALSCTLIVISHDRHFLENTVSKTLILENHEATLYNAPYSKYTVLRKADKEYTQKCYDQQQKEIAHIKEIIRTQKMWNQERNYVTAANWQKKLDRMELLEKPAAENPPPVIDFAVDTRGGNEVLTVEDLAFAFPDRTLFRGLSLKLMRNERLFIQGPNGCGKSTFLKLLTGSLSASEGGFRLGAGIQIAYYSQDFAELNDANTLFEEIFDAANDEYYHRQGGLAAFHDILSIRNALAAFGFRGEEVFKTVGTLSGGERARIALLKLTFKKSNLLILDEPTNHLDISTCEVLEDALLRYRGTVIAVSHDRYFTEKISTRVLDMQQYAVLQDLPETAAGGGSGKPGAAEAKNAYLRDRELKAAIRKYRKQKEQLEALLSSLEEQIAALEESLRNPEDTADYQAIQRRFEEKSALEQTLSEKETEYLICLDELEKLDPDGTSV